MCFKFEMCNKYWLGLAFLNVKHCSCLRQRNMPENSAAFCLRECAGV